MTFSIARRQVLAGLTAAVVAGTIGRRGDAAETTSGSQALRAGFPDWFRDAKFGISCQWTPQSFPEQGDWYAHNMYVQGSAQYRHHLQHFGHPSVVGYKDLCNAWRGEGWDPQALAERYRRAGARYLVALANHHDGFDCWNSRFQPWNSVNLGPRRDIVGEWGAAARGQSMHFGCEVFATRSWHWMNVSHGSDAIGPLAGVPYDGRLQIADGLGQWWQGYDPALLYHLPHGDAAPPDAAYEVRFVARTRDLIDRYRPELVFYTDKGLPLGTAGYGLARYQQQHVRRDAVIVTKDVPPELRAEILCDQLPADRIEPVPWQMDICIGDWHYKKGIEYRGSGLVIPYLVDVVAKNGNLLLNFPIRADGTLDNRELDILDAVGAWLTRHDAAIFGTRPWKVYGEGPTDAQPVDFPFWKDRFTNRDFRFTARGNTIYTFAMKGGERRLEIAALGQSSSPEIKIARVETMSGEPIDWRRTSRGLQVFLRKPAEGVFALAVRTERTGERNLKC